MIKKCYIVGAGDNSGTNFSKKENEYVIAADGGLKTLRKLKITPDLILGDFDSLGFVPTGDNVIRHEVEKDDTDMMLAVKLAIKKGYNDIVIFGGTGGRIDHTVANIQTMLWASRSKCRIKMIDAKNVYYVITDEDIILPAKESGIVSVFAIGGDALHVDIMGAYYKANDIILTEDNPTGVSNTYIGKDVTVSVGKGSLLIISEK